jgi:alanyl-tRNA synthetase
MVNQDVIANDGVETVVASRQEAEAMGAVAFFGDKYGERVRVVRAGSHSLEFCGGTHVGALGDIGQIQLVSEGSIGSNTRRLEAVTGLGAVSRSQQMEDTLGVLASLLKTSSDDTVVALQRLLERQRELEKSTRSVAPGAAVADRCGTRGIARGPERRGTCRRLWRRPAASSGARRPTPGPCQRRASGTRRRRQGGTRRGY